MKKKKLKEKKTGHHSSSSLGAERVVVLMSAVMVGAVGCIEMVVASSLAENEQSLRLCPVCRPGVGVMWWLAFIVVHSDRKSG